MAPCGALFVIGSQDIRNESLVEVLPTVWVATPFNSGSGLWKQLGGVTIAVCKVRLSSPAVVSVVGMKAVRSAVGTTLSQGQVLSEMSSSALVCY